MKMSMAFVPLFAVMALCMVPAPVSAAAPGAAAAAAQAAVSVVAMPVDYQVVQRDAMDVGMIPVKVTAGAGAVSVRARAVIGAGAKKGATTGWSELKSNGGVFVGEVKALAGGWYTLETEVRDAAGAVTERLSVKHVGVGDVFVTYGQSNSVSYGRNRTVSKSPLSVCMNPRSLRWQPCRDPQPTMGGAQGQGGSCWPSAGDYLTERLGVPVGFVACGWGGAKLSALIPGARNHYYENRLRDAIRKLPKRGFKAILYHQGESDSWGRTPQKVYVSQMKKLIAQSRKDAGWDVPWGIANISRSNVAFMPYEDIILKAQRQVAAEDPLVFNGPYTDAMDQNDQAEGHTQYRGDNTHFNARGAKLHGTWWGWALSRELYSLPVDTAELKFDTDTIKVGEPLAYRVTVRGQDGKVRDVPAELVTQYTGDAVTVADGRVTLKRQPKGMPNLRLFAKALLPGATPDRAETGNRLSGYVISEPVLLRIVNPGK